METSHKKRVLFVCVENSNRSQMAEAFARIHGGDRVEAFSAGSRPSGQDQPEGRRGDEAAGLRPDHAHSKGLDEFNGKEFDVAVTMGCGDECPLVLANRRVDWQIPDPKQLPPEEFREVRDLIETKVKELLAELDVTEGTMMQTFQATSGPTWASGCGVCRQAG